MLAYSSVSQMGVIAAAFGMALASADQGAATNVAFYAANHVLVKAALFLTLGAVAALDGRARTLALIIAALLGFSLAGLPLTGGALAKLAVKDQFSDGAAGVASQLSAAATTALMLVFVMRLARLPAADRVGTPSGLLWSWAALAVAVLLIPWLTFAAVGSPAEALEPAKLWDAIWPMLIGAALAVGLWAVGDRLPRIPAGDIVVAEEAAFRALCSLGRCVRAGGSRLAGVAGGGLALLMVALALVAAGYASRYKIRRSARQSPSRSFVLWRMQGVDAARQVRGRPRGSHGERRGGRDRGGRTQL